MVLTNSLALFIPSGVMEEINSIKNMISSRAIVSTVTEQVNYQMINDNMLFSEITNLNFHPARDLFYLTIFSISMLIQYNLIQAKNEKWMSIETYSNVKRVTNQFIFIVLMVFTKGIDNAI
jgi:hypothetical protein